MSSLLSSAYSWLTVGPPQVAALAVVGMVMWRRNWSSLLGVLLCLATFAGGAALVSSSTALPDVTAAHRAGSLGGMATATPLHLAAARSDTARVAALLAQGAQLEVQDQRGFTPLQAALAVEGTDAVQALLRSAGARDGVRFLDRDGLQEIMMSTSPAIIQLTTNTDVCQPGSSRCELEKLWRDVAERDGRAWRSVCVEAVPYRVPCAHILGGTPGWQEMRSEGHAIRIWNGSAFIKYTGAKRRKHVETYVEQLERVAHRRGDGARSAAPARYTMTVRPLPRAHNPTVTHFRKEYHERSIPVVIGGAMASWPSTGWGLEGFVAKCGTMPIARGVCEPNVPKRTPLSVTSLLGDELRWGGRVSYAASFFGVGTMAELVARQRQGEELYFFDMSVSQACPALADGTRAPKYFLTDMQQQAFKPTPAMPSLRRQRFGCLRDGNVSTEPSRHPSLFVFGNGTRTALHADSASTAFWMAVLAGRKRFRLFNSTDTACLYPHPAGERTAGDYPEVFALDSFAPDFERHPRATECSVWEGDVGPGEMIFIPAKWPHAVWNLEAGLALSYNFVSEVELPDAISLHVARMRVSDGDPFLSTREKHRAIADEAAAHIEAWLADGGAVDGAPERPSSPHIEAAIWLAAIGCGVLPFLPLAGQHVEAEAGGAADATWDSFLRSNRMEHVLLDGWGGFEARRVAQMLIRWLRSEAAFRLSALHRRASSRSGANAADRIGAAARGVVAGRGTDASSFAAAAIAALAGVLALLYSAFGGQQRGSQPKRKHAVPESKPARKPQAAKATKGGRLNRSTKVSGRKP